MGGKSHFTDPTGECYSAAIKGNAVLLPVVIEYNEQYVCEKKYEHIYRAISGDYYGPFRRPMLVDAVRNLCAELEIPKSLTELHVDPEKIPNMAEDAMKSGNVAVNPRPTTQADMEALFHQAM